MTAAEVADRSVVVVGFDGSEPSYRALDAAVRLIAGRTGSIEVVYVAHVPAGAEMSPGAQAEARIGFDEAEQEFQELIGSRLEGVEKRWHFTRRDGFIAHELLGVADQLTRDYGTDANIFIVVGSASHAVHHVVGSVPVGLVRHAKYPVLVVP